MDLSAPTWWIVCYERAMRCTYSTASRSGIGNRWRAWCTTFRISATAPSLPLVLPQMDMVFHLVSTTVPKTSNDDPAFDVMSNVVETIYLLEQCAKGKVKKIVFVSSGGAVYGTPAALPVPEDSPEKPESSYGITKLAIEKYLELFHRLYGLNYVILRPSNPYGERQNPDGDQGVIAVFLGKIAKGQAIDIWGDGSNVKDYVYIGDLIDGIYKAAFRDTVQSCLQHRQWHRTFGKRYRKNDRREG